MININGKTWSELEFNDIVQYCACHDNDESFYVEFKSNDVSPKDIGKEACAFANTFGGYIILGVTKTKVIEGCSDWDEDRIANELCDNVHPLPVFDIKRMTKKEKTIFVVKVNEGSKTPYVSSKGIIYTRVSSRCERLNNPSKIDLMLQKRQEFLKDSETMLHIKKPVNKQNNLSGLIDIGFRMITTNPFQIINIYNNANLEQIYKSVEYTDNFKNIRKNGPSIYLTLNAIESSYENNVEVAHPAHVNNFLEVMYDGSARMRLLMPTEKNDIHTVNATYYFNTWCIFIDFYKSIFGDIIDQEFVYALKYQDLTLFNQCKPFFHHSNIENLSEDQIDLENKYLRIKEKHDDKLGKDIFVTDDRIPKVGLEIIDRQKVENECKKVNSENIILSLFYCDFMNNGLYVEDNGVNNG